jgi:hypothetical protein
MHRYGFPADGLAGGGRSHEPTAISCANSIIHDIDVMLAKTDPDAAAHVRQRIDRSLTFLGEAVNRARKGKL